MKTAIALVLSWLFVAPAYGAVAVLVRTSTQSHFFNAATQVDGIAAISNLFHFQELRLPGLTPSDVGRIITLTEENAADYGFNWGEASSIFGDKGRDVFLGAGTVIDTDMHVEESGLRPSDRVNAMGLVNLQFRVVSWKDMINPPAPGYKTVVVEARMHYNIPEPSSLCLMLLGFFAITPIRRRA